jgi:hypothetical protein
MSAKSLFFWHQKLPWFIFLGKPISSIVLSARDIFASILSSTFSSVTLNILLTFVRTISSCKLFHCLLRVYAAKISFRRRLACISKLQTNSGRYHPCVVYVAARLSKSWPDEGMGRASSTQNLNHVAREKTRGRKYRSELNTNNFQPMVLVSVMEATKDYLLSPTVHFISAIVSQTQAFRL